MTGANAGIGLATARGLAARGGRVHLACRSEANGKAAVASLAAETGNGQVCFLPLDLASLASVRACARAFLAPGEPLHVLVNNADANEHGLTADGFEIRRRASSRHRPRPRQVLPFANVSGGEAGALHSFQAVTAVAVQRHVHHCGPRSHRMSPVITLPDCADWPDGPPP